MIYYKYKCVLIFFSFYSDINFQLTMLFLKLKCDCAKEIFFLYSSHVRTTLKGLMSYDSQSADN